MNNIEYGSDFHWIDFNKNQDVDYTFPKNANYFGSGRNALIAIIIENFESLRWKRVLLPTYYCDIVTEAVSKVGIPLVYYSDYPAGDDIEIISNIKFSEGDVIIRMNYFGLRQFRDNSLIKASVIEDHSHGFFSDWAINSNAEWCFASLRKEFPITDGGILWSPSNKKLTRSYSLTPEHQQIVDNRYIAMTLKSKYIKGESIEKTVFRNLFIETENKIGGHPISAISDISKVQLNITPFKRLYQHKKNNFKILSFYLSNYNKYIFKYEEILNSHIIPFSCVLIFDSENERNSIRDWLITNNIYPSILWNQSYKNDYLSKLFSETMLSIHIDLRYDSDDIKNIASILVDRLKYLD